MITVLLAEDEAMLRGALGRLLDLEPDLTVIAQAADGDAAIAETARHTPDVVVMDLEMPGGPDGLEAAGRILAARPGTRIVLVTRHARPGVLTRALRVGVRGFVPKSRPASQLAQVIREVHGGRRHVDPDIAASALTLDCPLTERELDVLRLTREGLSVREIAARVHLAAGTVRNYLSSAMTKVGEPSRHAAARYAFERGWL
ncbi:response regulator transcription factor (plasmid) [Embleya sp. NBC_00888]|uniref:response regulator transcription factor n=1 Tax=Embleya sp. NBC_00888 TaxID=2975960 RepID=UPI002F917AD6|nr:response regulator transcription factor [Embleya sp. NBC_00888]